MNIFKQTLKQNFGESSKQMSQKGKENPKGGKGSVKHSKFGLSVEVSRFTGFTQKLNASV